VQWLAAARRPPPHLAGKKVGGAGSNAMTPFHLAFPVRDLEETRRFCGEALGCVIGRPMVRFSGEPGEQATLFIRDPSGNALEFKGFRSLEQVFAH